MLGLREFNIMIIDKIPTPAGGFKSVWILGNVFKARLNISNSTESQVAFMQTGIETGTLEVDKSNVIKLNDYFFDSQNNKYYRITNIGVVAPLEIRGLQVVHHSIEWVKVMPK